MKGITYKMKNLKSKVLILLAFVLMITAAPVLGVQAASGTMTVSVSKTNVNVGDNFTVTVSYSGSTVLIYSQWTLKYDSSFVSSGEYGGVIPDRFDPEQGSNAKTFSKTYTFTAKEVGTPSFRVEDIGVYNMNPADGDTVSVAAPAAVSVKISARGSSNANLSSLKLSAGSLSPAFSNDVLSYTVTVPNSVNSISISAVAADPKAKISVSGGDAVPEGNSSRVVIVTAEDGTVKKFTININRAAEVKATSAPSPTPPTTPTNTSGVLPIPTTDPSNLPGELEVIAGGAILVISDKPEAVTLPTGFTEIEYTYKDRPVWAAQAVGQDILIMYLQDQANEKSGFYVYDEALDEFSKYIILYTQANSYTLLQCPETVSIPEGYVEKTAVIDSENVTVWVPASMKYMDAEVCEFYLVYAMSQNGTKGFYVYDTLEKTFQRFGMNMDVPADPDSSSDPNGTPGPGNVENPNPDEESEEEGGIWSGIKGFFSRIFTGVARAIDWFLFGFLIFVLVLIVVLVIFIVYATQKHKEEAEDEDFPLAAGGEKEKHFRKANLFTIDEEVREESEEALPDGEAEAPEEYAISEQETEEASESQGSEDVAQAVTEPEPENGYIPEPESVDEPEELSPEATEPTESDPLDFKIDDLKKPEEKPWSFDDEIGEDFFNDSEN